MGKKNITSLTAINRVRKRVESYNYQFKKVVTCQDVETAIEIIKKFDRLKKDDFDRILIPEFDYSIKDNVITYTQEYILSLIHI